MKKEKVDEDQVLGQLCAQLLSHFAPITIAYRSIHDRFVLINDPLAWVS